MQYAGFYLYLHLHALITASEPQAVFCSLRDLFRNVFSGMQPQSLRTEQQGQAGTAQKLILGLPTSHIGAPGFNSWLCFQFSIPAVHTLGSSR